ncbi:MAG: hypothetical protein CMJ31_00200 [Phycisphaerae bacterium]|nr:hypothetical protein [Phycisphaerae bacterium]
MVVSIASGQLASFRVVAMSGDPAPGTTDMFEGFSTPVVSRDGSVLFRGGTDALFDDSGLWVEHGGVLTAVALEGEDAALGDGSIFDSFLSYSQSLFVADGGVALFRAKLRRFSAGVTDENDDGLWINSGAGTVAIAREGDTPDGLGGAVAFPPNEIESIAALGVSGVALSRLLVDLPPLAAGEADAESLWMPDAPLFVPGDIAPGVGGDRFVSFSQPSVNPLGSVAFVGTLDGSIVRSEGVWTGPIDSLNVIARAGNPAVGVDNAVYRNFYEVSLNEAGDAAFRGLLITDDGSREWALWAGRRGAIRLVAREGQPAAGVEGGLFGQFITFAAMSAEGALFQSTLQNGPGGVTSTNNTGIWIEQDGELRLIVREGDEAPGANGATFNFLTRATANRRGDVAFRARVVLDGDPREGIWVYHASLDRLVPVVLEDDLIDVDPDPGSELLRRVRTLSFAMGSGGQDGRASGFGDEGNLVFHANFLGESSAVIAATLPCDGADLAQPYGTHDIADVVEFLSLFGAGDLGADLAAPSGTLDIADVVAFLQIFGAGCP